jgi:L-amino acid N-acyltransferase YncA
LNFTFLFFGFFLLPNAVVLKAIIEKAVSRKYNTIIAILSDINIGSVKLLEKFNFPKWGKLADVVTINDKAYSHLYYGLRL